MNKRTYSAILSLVVALLAIVLVNASAERRVEARRPLAASYTLSSLPASDAVIYIDAQRLLNDSIPGVLINNPKLLARVNQRIDQFKEKTNVDLRSFDSVAIGIRFTPPSERGDFKLVLLAQGRFDANAVLDAALGAASRSGFYPQERQYDGRSLYLLSRQKQEAERPEQTTDKQEAPPNRQEAALAVIDANTFAFGDFESVRAALDISTERVSDELVQLATRTPSAVVGFSGNVPSFFKEQLAKDKETIARNFATVQKVYGSITVNGSDTETSMTLRTETAEQARNVHESINALKMLVGFAPGGKSSPGDMKPLPELIKALTITNEGNEVFLNLKLTQSDVASFVRNF